MINLIRKSSLCAGRTLVLNTSRSLVSSPHCQIQASDTSWIRRVRLPLVGGKLLKDSDFVDTEEFSEDIDTDPGHLERSYDEHVSEVKDEKKKIRQIMAKKKFVKYSKEPMMLTFNEREHMKFLHKSDPDEWNVDRLSKSFPLLPYAVRKILKNKWSPSSSEKIKEMDAKVLENWEKLKRNELEASPKFLEHLKKFANRYENLKAQLENPKFFPELDVPEKVSWGDGPLTGLVKKYERDLERLKSRHMEKIALTQGGNSGEVAIATNEKNVRTIEDVIKMETEIREIEDDTFMIGKPPSRSKQVTLDALKQDILKKADKGKKRLSKFEEAVLDKTLPGRSQSKEKVKVAEEVKSTDKYKSCESDSKNFKRKESQERSHGIFMDKAKEHFHQDRELGEDRMEGMQQFGDDEETDKDLRVDDKTRKLDESELGQFLQRLRGEEEKMKATEEEKIPKVPKTLVDFYGTKKDDEMVDRDVELLSGSCFWGLDGKSRKKSEDAATWEKSSLNTKASPHVSPTLKTYFTYDYPDEIKIPKDQWMKGKTYRVKDCYYDDDGKFLYRVPGVTND